MKIGGRYFIGCQAVVVRGRTKIVCLLGTYCHKRLTNGATYGIVTFDGETGESFVIKSDGGPIAPTEPVQLASDQVWKGLRETVDVPGIIAKMHQDKTEGELKTWTLSSVACVNGRKSTRKRKQTSFLKDEIEEKQAKSKSSKAAVDDEATETDNEEETFQRRHGRNSVNRHTRKKIKGGKSNGGKSTGERSMDSLDLSSAVQRITDYGASGEPGEYRAIVNGYPALRDLIWDDFRRCTSDQVEEWLGETRLSGPEVTFGHRMALKRLHSSQVEIE